MRRENSARCAGDYLKLPPTVLRADSQRVDANAGLPQSACRNDDVIIRNPIRRDHQNLRPTRVGVSLEKEIAGSLHGQTSSCSSLDVRYSIYGLQDRFPAEVSCERENWLGFLGERHQSDMSASS